MNGIITDRTELIQLRKRLKEQNKTLVFTNGCFDIMHAGHVDYLSKAKSMGDVLLVAVNSDDSVKKIKGKNRPVVNETERMFVLSQLKPVDIVTVFNEDTPEEIIKDLIPDVLVKGADWDIEKIVGRDIVEKNGGSVRNIKFEIDQSTTKIINRILEIFKE